MATLDYHQITTKTWAAQPQLSYFINTIQLRKCSIAQTKVLWIIKCKTTLDPTILQDPSTSNHAHSITNRKWKTIIKKKSV